MRDWFQTTFDESKGFRLSFISVLAFAAFSLRFFLGLYKGEDDFWRNGYVQYIDIARSLWQHGDFLLQTSFGEKAAFWPPIYPLLFSATSLGGTSFLYSILAASLVGAMTVVIVFLTGRELFGSFAGAVGASLAAIYPYYVFHDTAIQDTGTYAFVNAATVFLLVKVPKSNSRYLLFGSGLLLALTTLTRATALPFALLVLIWITLIKGRAAGMVFLGFLLLIGPWVIRNSVTIGSPSLTSQSGRFLWIANNPETFAHYPQGSIDRSEMVAWQAIPSPEQEMILAMDEDDQSRYFWKKGRDYILQDGLQNITKASYKILSGFSLYFNPDSTPLKQTAYLLSYGPILLLGVIGMYSNRRRWRDHIPIYLCFCGFVVPTALFWAHTSHRVFLDVFFMIFAGNLVSQIILRRRDKEPDLLTS